MSGEKNFIYTKGNFPFPIVDDSKVGDDLSGHPAINSLNGLMKCYWLAKSFDWAIDIAYSIPFESASGTDDGTTVGGGTINVISSHDRFATVAPIPSTRTVYEDSFPIGQNGNQMPFVSNGTITFTGGGTEGYSLSAIGLMFWFCSLFDASGNKLPGTVSKDLINRFRSNVEAPFFVGAFGAALLQLNINQPYNGETGLNNFSTGASFTLKIAGEADVVIPIISWTSEATGGTITGSITLNFNNFWS